MISIIIKGDSTLNIQLDCNSHNCLKALMQQIKYALKLKRSTDIDIDRYTRLKAHNVQRFISPILEVDSHNFDSFELQYIIAVILASRNLK